MNGTEQVSSSSHGIKWGLIIGLIYAVLVFLRYAAGANNPFLFGMFTLIGYIAILILLFYSGYRLRKENGGWILMKEAFKAMFIAVLILELFYAATTYIYLKMIDPDFFEKIRISTEEMLTAAKQSQKDIDEALAGIDNLAEQTKRMDVVDILKSYLTSVGITGLFALLFSFIIKRKPPGHQVESFPQS